MPRCPLTDQQWSDLRAAYEGGESEASLSKRFHVDRKTIRARRRAEHWIPQPHPQVGKAESQAVHERATAEVIDLASRRAVQQAQDSGTIDRIVDQVASGLLAHAEIERLMLAFAKDTLEKSLKGELSRGKVTSEASERKDAMAAAAMAIDKSREISGKRAGQPSVDDKRDKPKRIVFVKAGPPKTETA